MRLSSILILAGLLLCGNSPAFDASSSQQRRAKNGNLIYEDYSIPVPEGKPASIDAGDLVLTDRFLPLYPDGISIADNEGLHTLYNYYKNDPQGCKEWQNLQSKAITAVSSWDMEQLIHKRYVYSVTYLEQLARVYIFTGNEHVSDFIRGHLAKMASLPQDFWSHAELRTNYFSKKEEGRYYGFIETAYINQSLPTAITAVRRNMSPEEIETIEKAWYQKGHLAGVHWLEDLMTLHNFTAVIAAGVLCSSKYFGDEDARALALKGLKYYACEALYPDGSCGEGYPYYQYPLGQLFKAALAMDPEEINATFGESPIRGSMIWRVYGQLFDTDSEGRQKKARLSFCDGHYMDNTMTGVDEPAAFSRLVFSDPLAAWYATRFGQKDNLNIVLLRAKLRKGDASATEPAPKGPAELGLPLMKSFDCGDCFMRKGWDDNGICLSMRVGDGAAAKNHPHNRPEINSIALGAYGEYLIVTSGCSSYRSPIRTNYDLRTRAANTVTVDGMNQKYPFKSKEPWVVRGEPKSELTAFETLPDGSMYMRNEVKELYHIPMREAYRSVRFFPEEGFFVVRAVLVPEDGQNHCFESYMHIYNRDFASRVRGGASSLKIERPSADLYFAVRSKGKPELFQGEGYLHGPAGRDYDPGGPQEGKKGSAIELGWREESGQLDLVTVIYPKKAGAKAPKIRFLSEEKINVDGKTITLDK